MSDNCVQQIFCKVLTSVMLAMSFGNGHCPDALTRLTLPSQSHSHPQSERKQDMVRAPLRLVIAQSTTVLREHQGKPSSFIQVHTLECGHTKECYSLGLRDLANAYTEHPFLNARRHRCRRCLTTPHQEQAA